MYLSIKLIISVIFIVLWLRACRNDLVPSLGNSFLILFLVTLIDDIFALNQKMIALNEHPFSFIHITMDRIIILPLSLFILQSMSKHLLINFLLSVGWIFIFKMLETLNERAQIVELANWTPLKWGYIGGIVIGISLLFAYFFKKLIRSTVNNAPSN